MTLMLQAKYLFCHGLIWPGSKKSTFSDKIISNQIFEDSDVSQQMLTKIKRNNRIVLESEGAGVVIARLD